MHIATKVAYNTIIQAISKILSTILGLIAVALITRYLGQNGFGEYTTIVTFLSFFGIMADLGLTLVTIQMISHPGVDQKKVLNNLFSLRFFSAFIFLGLAIPIAFFFPYGEAIKNGIVILSLSFFFIALNQILIGFFQKSLRMDKAAIAEIFGRIILVTGTILAISHNFGLSGIMWSVVAGSVANFFILLFLSLKFFRLKFEFDFSLWRKILTRSWPLAVTIVFNLLYLKTDTLFLSLIKSQSEVGLYGAAYKVIEVLTMFPFMFAGVVLPILTTDWFEKKTEHFNKVLQKSFDLMIILALPLIVGTQFLAKPIMAIVAGQDFLASGEILKILIVAAGLVFISCLLSHAVVAAGKQKEIIWSYFFTAITSVIGYFIFIPKFSYFGAAWVTIYSEATITAFMFFYASKFVSFKPKLKIILKAFLASLVMALALFLIPAKFLTAWWSLSLVIISVSALYFIVTYLFKGLTKDDLLRLLNKKPE